MKNNRLAAKQVVVKYENMYLTTEEILAALNEVCKSKKCGIVEHVIISTHDGGLCCYLKLNRKVNWGKDQQTFNVGDHIGTYDSVGSFEDIVINNCKKEPCNYITNIKDLWGEEKEKKEKKEKKKKKELSEVAQVNEEPELSIVAPVNEEPELNVRACLFEYEKMIKKLKMEMGELETSLMKHKAEGSEMAERAKLELKKKMGHKGKWPKEWGSEFETMVLISYLYSFLV